MLNIFVDILFNSPCSNLTFLWLGRNLWLEQTVALFPFITLASVTYHSRAPQQSCRLRLTMSQHISLLKGIIWPPVVEECKGFLRKVVCLKCVAVSQRQWGPVKNKRRASYKFNTWLMEADKGVWVEDKNEREKPFWKKLTVISLTSSVI